MSTLIEWIIVGGVVVIFLVLIIISHIARVVFKILALIFSVFFIVGVVLGFFVVRDVMDFKEKVTKEPMAFAFVDGSNVLASIVFKPNMTEPAMLSSEDKAGIVAKTYDPLLKKYYKLWIIKQGIVDDISTENFQVSGYNITKQQVRSVLVSDKPWEVIGLPAGNFSADEIRAAVFGSVFFGELGKNPIFLVKEFKKGNIEVEKETPLFKMMQYIPLSLIEIIAKKFIPSGGN